MLPGQLLLFYLARMPLTRSLAVLMAVAEESDLIPPAPNSFAAQFGLELHQKFGWGKNIALAKAIASEKALAHEQIHALADFF